MSNMAFTGVQIYSACISPNLIITIGERGVEVGKITDGFIHLSITEWYDFLDMIDTLEAKLDCFKLLFSGEQKKGVYSYYCSISGNLSAGILMMNEHPEVYIRTQQQYTDDEIPCGNFYTLILDIDEFQALKWYQMEICNFINYIPLVHEVNKVHSLEGGGLLICELCHEIKRNGSKFLNTSKIHNKFFNLCGLNARKKSTPFSNRPVIFHPGIDYIEVEETGQRQKEKKVLLVNLARGETTDL